MSSGSGPIRDRRNRALTHAHLDFLLERRQPTPLEMIQRAESYETQEKHWDQTLVQRMGRVSSR